MRESPEMRSNKHWRSAVWGLRVGYGGLAVALGGLVAVALGAQGWLLAAGVLIWLAAAVVTVTGVVRCHRELPTATRPGLWAMRFMLIRDTVHSQSSSAD